MVDDAASFLDQHGAKSYHSMYYSNHSRDHRHHRDESLKSGPFGISREELITLHSSRSVEELEMYGGVAALSKALRTDLKRGLSMPDDGDPNDTVSKHFNDERKQMYVLYLSSYFSLFHDLLLTLLMNVDLLSLCMLKDLAQTSIPRRSKSPSSTTFGNHSKTPHWSFS